MSGLAAHLGTGMLLHDALTVRGGAERVMVTMAQSLPISSWCVAAWDREAFPPEELAAPVQVLGVTATTPVWRTVAGLRAFRRVAPPAEALAWAIYSGFNAPVAVHQELARRSVLYCHALPRFAYDLHDYYIDQLPRWKRSAFHALVAAVRPRFEAAVRAMDVVLVNSQNVQGRLEHFLDWPSEVLHPPVETHRFLWKPDRGYFLSTARLEEYKRVDRIVRAFKELPEHRLVVTSDGSQREALEVLAAGASNIHFTGGVTDDELSNWIGGALATIYLPHDEDFGLSPLESMAAGKPVLGVAEGGLLETMVDGETGWLLPPDPGVACIRDAVAQIRPDEARAMRAACEARASRFGHERFLKGICEVLARGEA